MLNRNKIAQIYEADRRINRVYEIWSAAHGLTLYEMQIYYVIMEQKSRTITQKDLCQELDAPKTSINSIIKKQLKTGYIEMNVNPLNKREKVISLTESGKLYAEQLIQPLFQYEEEAVSMLKDEEIEMAIMVQNKFADLLLDKIEVKNK